MGGSGRVVVGVNGSDGSREALRFAASEAVRRGARLLVVWAFPWPDAHPTAEQVTADLESRARQMVDGLPGDRPPAVDVLALTGSPGRVLVEQSEGAELLVVGHRGRGALASAVLGSVGLYCVLHAPCAVVVVRPGPGPTGGEGPAPAATARAVSGRSG